MVYAFLLFLTCIISLYIGVTITKSIYQSKINRIIGILEDTGWDKKYDNQEAVEEIRIITNMPEEIDD